MGQATIRNPTPQWLREKSPSVMDEDSSIEQAIKWLAGLIGADDPNSQVLGIAAPMEVGAVTSPIAQAIAAVSKRIKSPIKAYHASPHDFDQFSLSKIGTGEGAQAYGHGLYFAENPAVSGKGGEYHRQFTEQLRRANPVTYPGGEAVNGTLEHRMLLDLKNEGAAAIERWERSIAGNLDYAPDQAALQKSVLDKVRHVDPATINAPDARAYEVSIHADPEDFLDWDAPLSPKQSEAAYKSLGDVRPVKQANGYYGVTMVGPDGSGKIIQGINEQTPEAAMVASRQWMDNIRGNDAYSVLSGIKGDKVKAAEDLRKAGIPGIKYLDGASRSAGQGSRNYVVFDDQLIEIVKKYGIAAALGAGLIQSGDVDQLKEMGFQ